MKIICIARNYTLHAAEMGAPQFQHGSQEAFTPAFFLKPETALLSNSAAPQGAFLLFPYPAFSHQVEHEIEVVVRIDRDGKDVPEEQAQDYYSEVTVGIDFTARDLQREAKAKGLPWTLSKGFDCSAAVGRFVALKSLGADVQNLQFSLTCNGQTVQSGSTADMLCPVDKMISYVSKFMTLKAGDLIFTGTPAGVGPVVPGDILTGNIGTLELLHCQIL